MLRHGYTTCLFAPRPSFICARLMQLLHHINIFYIWINSVISYTFRYYSINKTCDGPKIKKRVPKNWTICEMDSFRPFQMLSESFKELAPNRKQRLPYRRGPAISAVRPRAKIWRHWPMGRDSQPGTGWTLKRLICSRGQRGTRRTQFFRSEKKTTTKSQFEF